MEAMEKIVLNLPTLYADHHVMILRDALLALDGVSEVYASSAWRQAVVSYDPQKTDDAAIEGAVVEAGYPVGEAELPMLVQREKIGRDPQWVKFDQRVSKTNRVDLEMSGEHRRY
jgi:copper chaperone CopZ